MVYGFLVIGSYMNESYYYSWKKVKCNFNFLTVIILGLNYCSNFGNNCGSRLMDPASA